MTRINPGTIIVSAVLLVVAIMVLTNSNITVPAGGWLVASLLGAVFIYVVGERLIKQWGLTDFSATATRVAFAFGALVVAGIGIYNILAGNISPGVGMPTWLETAVNDIGWFGVISLGVIAATLLFGIWRYRLIPGNTSAYLFMSAVGFFIIVGGAYVIMMKLAPRETEMILGAAKNDIQGAAQGLVKTDPYGGTSIKWEKFSGFKWEVIGGIALACALTIIFIHQYISKNKIVVTTAAAVAALAFLLLSYSYATRWEVTNKLIEGASEKYGEVIGGDNHFVNLAAAPGHKLVVANIGPYDTLTVYLPPGSSVDWRTYPGYEDIPGYDPGGYHMYNTTGSSGFQRYYAFTEEFSDGLDAAGKTVTMEIWAVQ